NWWTRAKVGRERSLGQRGKGEPLWPVAADHFFQHSRPILHRIGDDYVPRYISRRFVSSAFHQRNNPLRSNFVTRKSGTKPSYSSRQPTLCLAKRPVAKRRFASATRRRL